MPRDMALAAEHGYWNEHPDLPLREWQYEVQNNTTRRGYWEWVVAELEAANDAG